VPGRGSDAALHVNRITWGLGVRPGRPPPLRLEGDRYATTSTPGGTS